MWIKSFIHSIVVGMMFKRKLDLNALLEKKSHFLFGPRGTGKSTLIKQNLSSDILVINLLESQTRIRLLQNPQELESLITPHNPRAVVIDEIQKVPELLDEVHRLIEDKKIRFLLTGSSARKLKRTSSNLLGGRARIANLFPLTYSEIPQFDLTRYLNSGGLPFIYSSEEPYEDLIAYVDAYLNEEIEQEAQVRNLGKFARFLKCAALSNAEQINYANIASDAMVSESTVRNHYLILKDTLIGDLLEPWKESKKRKAIQTPKFYFFDTGVTHAIAGKKNIQPHSSDYGHAFESFIYMELRAALSYQRTHIPLNYWRSVNQQEVDFVIGESTAIEVKAKVRVTLRDTVGLQALREEKVFKKFYVVSLDPQTREEDGIVFLHWKKFLEQLWSEEIYPIP